MGFTAKFFDQFFRFGVSQGSFVVLVAGIEPAAIDLEGRCSSAELHQGKVGVESSTPTSGRQ